MKNSHTIQIIKILVVVVAVLNLIALFFFRYHQSPIPNEPSGYTSVYLSGSDESEETPSTEEEPASSGKKKPDDYEGPSITLSKDLPEIDQADLDRIPTVLHDLDLLSADDGTGKDISSTVTCTYIYAEGRDFDVVFKVRNEYGDTAKETAVITVNITKPILLLTQDHVNLSAGDTFDAKDYLDCAVDTDGTDISKHVVTTGTVKTKTPGTYEVDYSVTGQKNDALTTVTLTVIVK